MTSRVKRGLRYIYIDEEVQRKWCGELEVLTTFLPSLPLSGRSTADKPLPVTVLEYSTSTSFSTVQGNPSLHVPNYLAYNLIGPRTKLFYYFLFITLSLLSYLAPHPLGIKMKSTIIWVAYILIGLVAAWSKEGMKNPLVNEARFE